MDNGFIENGFIIDLSNAKKASQIIYELSNILDMPEAKNRKICLKLNNIDLTQSQLLSIKALIESMDAELGFIDTDSQITESSALAQGITVSSIKNEIPNQIEDKNCEEAKDDDASEEQTISVVKPECEEQQDLLSNDFEPQIFEEVAQSEGIMEAKSEQSYVPLETENIDIDEEMEDDVNIAKLPTLYLNQTLRSGQTISYDGNIVLTADANPGSELIARGDIIVWGVLGGIAHAGSKGCKKARIRALKLNAIQLRIATYYARRQDIGNMPYIQRSSAFTPEEAHIHEKQIVITKTKEN